MKKAITILLKQHPFFLFEILLGYNRCRHILFSQNHPNLNLK